MFHILKTKLEIILTLLVVFQGHALYVKHHKLAAIKQAEAAATATVLQKHHMTAAAMEQELNANIVKDIPPEVAAELPVDINNPAYQSDTMTKEQAIELINSIPD